MRVNWSKRSRPTRPRDEDEAAMVFHEYGIDRIHHIYPPAIPDEGWTPKKWVTQDLAKNKAHKEGYKQYRERVKRSLYWLNL